MIENAIEKYSKQNLLREIRAIKNSDRNTEVPELTIYEKSIVYKYSEDGYETVNEILRDSKGKENTEFGKLLNIVLDKLPSFDGLVYRSANLTTLELQRYSEALKTKDSLKEYSFISTSKSRLTAMAFNGNVLFRMYSRSGKEIEKIAKFGPSDPPNEKEVLFKFNRKFKVLEIKEETNYSLITMEEI